MIQFGSGLRFAHEKKVAHLDLKPENILFLAVKYKIADWGGSLRLNSPAPTILKSNIMITPGYNAPEIKIDNYGDNKKYNFLLYDVYSLGMVTLRMCGISL